MAVLRPGSLWFSLKATDTALRGREPSRVALRVARSFAVSVTARPSSSNGLPVAAPPAVAVVPTHELPESSEPTRLSVQLLEQALVERARVEAELEGRNELARRCHEHERRLAEIRRGLEARRYRWLFAGSVCVVVVLAVSVGVFAREEHRARSIAEQREKLLGLERQSRRHATRLLELAREREVALKTEVDRLTAEAARATNPRE